MVVVMVVVCVCPLLVFAICSSSPFLLLPRLVQFVCFVCFRCVFYVVNLSFVSMMIHRFRLVRVLIACIVFILLLFTIDVPLLLLDYSYDYSHSSSSTHSAEKPHMQSRFTI